jgi:hypothetical protein
MALAGNYNVRRLSRYTSVARVNPDGLADLERAAFRETERRVRWCRWNQEWREKGKGTSILAETVSDGGARSTTRKKLKGKA